MSHRRDDDIIFSENLAMFYRLAEIPMYSRYMNQVWFWLVEVRIPEVL